MTTLNLKPTEAIKKIESLIKEKDGFDCFSKNSQYCFDNFDNKFCRINLWSDNCHDYNNNVEFVSQLKRSFKGEDLIQINIYQIIKQNNEQNNRTNI